MPKPVPPDQVEQQVYAAIRKRIVGDHVGVGDPHLKGAIHFDPSAIDAKFQAFEPKLKQFLQLVGPIDATRVTLVVSAALAFYDSVHGVVAPAAG